MSKLLPPEVEPLILTLSKEGRSIRQVQKALSDLGYDVSKGTVHHVIQSVGKKRQAVANGENIPPKPQPRPARKKAVSPYFEHIKFELKKIMVNEIFAIYY